MLNTLYMMKFDGDETPTHPWTVVKLERRRSTVGGAEVTFKIVDVAQMGSWGDAADLVMRLQRGEVTLEGLTWDEPDTLDEPETPRNVPSDRIELPDGTVHIPRPPIRGHTLAADETTDCGPYET